MNKKEIEKRYRKLINDVKIDPFYKVDLTNRVNCYKCVSCGHITKTRDIDAGVTPFMHQCEVCNVMAQSSFYNNTVPEQQPTEEWYRPSLEECYKLNENMVEHVLLGGLICRKITNSLNEKNS